MKLADTARVRCIGLPCNDIADKMGNARLLNMIALGAYIKATGVLPIERVQGSLHHVVSEHYHHLLPKNAEALKTGYDAA
jgi:2-oxoglutarate ferredoxin oxidoreductase subunit gamma